MPPCRRSTPTPELAATWRPGSSRRAYDGRSLPATDKTGATLGMAMTEKQGGSDLRANTTRAERDGDGLAPRRPQVVLLGADVRRLPDAGAGARGPHLLPRAALDARRRAQCDPADAAQGQARQPRQRLGRDRVSRRLGAGRSASRATGCATIIEMVHHTRLDTAMAPAGLMRAALAEALWWCANRTAFQRRLIDQPLMAAVLADLALEAEARSRSACASRAPSTRATAALRPHRRRARQVPRTTGAARRSSSKRWSASAGSATSRKGRCRSSIARRRSTRSGKVRAT